MEKNTEINKTNELQNLMKEKNKTYEVQCSKCKATVITDDLKNWNLYGGFCKSCLGKIEEQVRKKIMNELKEKEEIKQQKELERKKNFKLPRQKRRGKGIANICIDDNTIRYLKKGKRPIYDRAIPGYNIVPFYEPTMPSGYHGYIESELRETCKHCSGKGYVKSNESKKEIQQE